MDWGIERRGDKNGWGTGAVSQDGKFSQGRAEEWEILVKVGRRVKASESR